MQLRGEPVVRAVFVFRVFLDSVHHYDIHIPSDLQRGQQTGETDPFSPRQPSVASAQRRGAQLQWWLEQDVDAARGGSDACSVDADQGQEHHQDETGTQGGEDPGHHHGHVHPLLAALLLVVRDEHSVRSGVPGRGDDTGVLGGILQLDPQPAHLRLLQPRVPRGVPEHAAVRVLQPLSATSLRPGRPGHAAAQSTVRRPHSKRLLRDLPQAHRPSPLLRARVVAVIRADCIGLQVV